MISLYTMAMGSTPFGNLAMGVLASSAGVKIAVSSFALTALATVLGIGSKRVRAL